jgi:hypothetical protein
VVAQIQPTNAKAKIGFPKFGQRAVVLGIDINFSFQAIYNLGNLQSGQLFVT